MMIDMATLRVSIGIPPSENLEQKLSSVPIFLIPMNWTMIHKAVISHRGMNMYKTIRRQAPDALNRLLHSYDSLDCKLRKEYFCSTLLSISNKCEKEKISYYKRILASILLRGFTSKKDARLIKRLVKFCSKHPIEAASYVTGISPDLQEMFGIDTSGL